MSTPALIAEPQLHLRREAEVRLRQGTAPKAKVVAADFPALSVLQDMASAAGSASAALKLLHELQVHQVELDLQAEQLEQSRDDLSLARDQYVERFDYAPVASCVVARDGRIIEANHAAAALFGVESDALAGQAIDRLLAAPSQPACRALLQRVSEGSGRESLEVQIDAVDRSARRYRMLGAVLPSNGSISLMWVDIG